MHEFGTSICRWREAVALLSVAAADMDTWLAVKVHGLKYRAREDVTLTNQMLVWMLSEPDSEDRENLNGLLPFKRKTGTAAKTVSVSTDEYEAATLAMLEKFGVDPAAYEVELGGILAERRQVEKTDRELREWEAANG